RPQRADRPDDAHQPIDSRERGMFPGATPRSGHTCIGRTARGPVARPCAARCTLNSAAVRRPRARSLARPLRDVRRMPNRDRLQNLIAFARLPVLVVAVAVAVGLLGAGCATPSPIVRLDTMSNHVFWASGRAVATQ